MTVGMGPGRSDTDSLFPLAQKGDQAAWQALVTACYPKVVRAVRRKLTSRQMRTIYDSGDFANDVLFSLATKSDRYDFPNMSALVAFLVEEVNRKVIDEVRRQTSAKRDMHRTTSLDHRPDAGYWLEPPASDPTPSQVCVAKEMRQRLVSGLDDVDRRVIEMRELDYSNEEIAEKVGWSVRKVQRFLQHQSRKVTARGPGAAL